MARGLDVPAVQLVINYDLPYEIEEYVHRSVNYFYSIYLDNKFYFKSISWDKLGYLNFFD